MGKVVVKLILLYRSTIPDSRKKGHVNLRNNKHKWIDSILIHSWLRKLCQMIKGIKLFK